MAKRGCSFLPEELILKVLLLVPVVSLVRCKLVCKLWLSIISNPQFIQTHLTNSHKKQSSLMWISTFPSDDDDDESSPSCDDDDDDESYPSCDFYDVNYFDETHEYTVRMDLPPYFACVDISMNTCLRIVRDRFIQTCNGLISIVGVNADAIYLLNPAMTQMRELPVCHNISLDILYLGFGFDPISNDYKLLRVVFAHTTYEYWAIENLVLEAELYSANDNCWKEIEVPEPLRGFRPCDDSKCVHAKTGMLYMNGFNEILWFDLHNEVFGVYPIHKDDKLLKISNVFDFEGSLAMMFKDDVSEGSVVSLWTLDNASENASWTKKFNFEVALNMDWVHLYLGVGQFVALNYDLGVIFYDYIKKETTKFPLISSTVGEIVSVVNYTESLVALEGFKRFNLSGRSIQCE